MPTTPDELRDFHRLISEQLNAGRGCLSPEEVLAQWRKLRPREQAMADDIAAVQEALDDMASGDRGVPFDEFDREFRRRHQIPTVP